MPLNCCNTPIPVKCDLSPGIPGSLLIVGSDYYGLNNLAALSVIEKTGLLPFKEISGKKVFLLVKGKEIDSVFSLFTVWGQKSGRPISLNKERDFYHVKVTGRQDLCFIEVCIPKETGEKILSIEVDTDY